MDEWKKCDIGCSKYGKCDYQCSTLKKERIEQLKEDKIEKIEID
jgi:hypothetical protein